MLSPAREPQPWEGSTSTFDSTHGGVEFGTVALQGYTFNIDVPPKEDGIEGSNLVQSLGARALASFAEFSVNAAGRAGLDGLRGEHGIPGRKGASGADGKDGYGPGRPGKPGKSGKDGKPGSVGKKGKKGANGTNGGKASNVVLKLSGEGPKSITVSGHLERVVPQKQVEEQQGSSESLGEAHLSLDEPLVERSPLEIVHLLNTPGSQVPVPEVDGTNKSLRESSAVVVADDQHGSVLRFVSQNGVISVCAHGGRGGNGGNGGNGGYGGDGGNGGKGGNGGHGKRGLKPGFSGENGGKGGNGGSGFGGSAGGDGGPAGKGGNGGAGSHVIIETTNAKLLMLVETDARAGLQGKAGKPGLGGEGGKAGRGGAPGFGGQGGPPWDKLYLKKHRKFKRYYHCVPGIDGQAGRMGGLIGQSLAPRGNPGSPAVDGKEAKDGKVTWILKSPDGEIIEKAKDRFNCAVCQFRVKTGSGNGIISPGGTVTVDKVVVWNNGGMTLPEGTRLTFAANGVFTTSSKGQKDVEMLPAIKKGKRYKCHTSFSMRVEKLDGPAGGSPFQAMVSVGPSLELSERKFSVADQVLEVPVQYPVQIVGNVQFPHSVHQGRMVSLTINVENISSRSYGQSKRSLGSVEGMVLFFLELETGQRVEQRWTKSLPEIGAGQKEQFQFDCRVDSNGQPYSILSVQVHLLLKGQSIEYRHLESRIIPVYSGTNADAAVLVTDTAFKPGVYNLWKSMLALLGVSCVFWDISWHRSNSLEPIPWLGKHHLVIFTHAQEDLPLSYWLRNVLPEHARALGGPQYIDNAGAIFVGPNTKDIAREIVDWSNRETLSEVKLQGCVAGCLGDESDSESMKRVILKASQMQNKMRSQDLTSHEYTIVISPLQNRGSERVPLLLFREALPTMFRTRAISVQMTEDSAGVHLLESSPLLTIQEPPIDIYSGISTAIGGLIQSSSSSTQRRRSSGHPIALVGKHNTLGLTLAGMIVSMPIRYRVEILFRFSRHPPSDLPVLSTSGITLSEVIGISFYNDLKADWVSRRQAFPHGQSLVTEFRGAVSARGLANVVEMEPFVVPLTGGLVLLRDELKGISQRKSNARRCLRGLLMQIRSALWETQVKYLPKAERVRTDYKNLQERLPPWLFSYVDELQVIRVLDDPGIRKEK